MALLLGVLAAHGATAQRLRQDQETDRCKLVGPAGFEPATKGFTSAPMFPKGVDYLFTRARTNESSVVGRWGAGRSSL